MAPRVIRIPARKAPELELVPVLVVAVPPAKGNDLVRLLCSKFQLTKLPHVKRVRKWQRGAEPVLDIIVCLLPAESGETGPGSSAGEGDAAGTCHSEDGLKQPGVAFLRGQVEPAVDSFLEDKGLWDSVRVAQVPCHQPTTRELWAQWSEVWPLSWKRPVLGVADSFDSLPSEEESAVLRNMERARELLVSQPAACNAAIIVDPDTGHTVGAGCDARQSHPLAHAVMVALQQAADWNLAAWPGLVAAPELKRPCADVLEGRPFKAHCSGGESLDQAAPSTAPAHCSPSAAQAPADGDGGDGHVAERDAAPRGMRPYLCSGFDCYVWKEPCVMCAMALVHSRLRRVVYCQPDTAGGALGGAFALHAVRSLNHHYEVFRALDFCAPAPPRIGPS